MLAHFGTRSLFHRSRTLVCIWNPLHVVHCLPGHIHPGARIERRRGRPDVHPSVRWRRRRCHHRMSTLHVRHPSAPHSASQYLFVFAPKYKEVCAQHAPRSPPPEARLPMANWGGPMFITAIFWLGWTSYPSISIWAPMMAGFLLGISLTFIFVSLVFPESTAHLICVHEPKSSLC